MSPQDKQKLRERQETRIIITGLLLGAAAGGITVMLLRMRDARRSGESPKPISTVIKEMSWPEVFSTAAAALTLARRIGGLQELPGEKAKR